MGLVHIIGPDDLARWRYQRGQSMHDLARTRIDKNVLACSSVVLVVDCRFFENNEFAIYTSMVKCRYDDNEIMFDVNRLCEKFHYSMKLYEFLGWTGQIQNQVFGEIKDFFKKEIGEMIFQYDMKYREFARTRGITQANDWLSI